MIDNKRVFDKQHIIEVLSPQVGKAWKDASFCKPDFLTGFDDYQKKENEKRISGHKERLEKQINSFPYPALRSGKRKKWKEATEKMFDEILWTDPLLDVRRYMSEESLTAFENQAREFMKRARKFDAGLVMADIGQALRNYIVYATFLELSGLPQRCSSAIFGYSMLYPYTDNYIDDPERSPEEKQHFNRMIGDFLQGRPYEAVSQHEKKTAELLAAVEEDYARGDAIYTGLYNMLDAQRISQQQSDHSIPMRSEDILGISIYKGGISVLIDRYFINHPVSEQDLYFYFAFGFMLQLCDDLQDIGQDRKDGSRTVFTGCGTKTEVEECVNRLLHYTKNVFHFYESRNEKFKQFLLQNSYLLILISAVRSGEYISGEWLAWAEERIPVSSGYLDTMQGSLLIPVPQAVQEEGRSPGKGYMRMLDALLE